MGDEVTGAAERLARHRHLRLTTFRRSGEPVHTPIWCTCLDGRVYVRTAGSSGKVKRIRIRPDVLLTPCDMRGRVSGGAEETAAHAVVLDCSAAPEAVGRLRRKYAPFSLLIDAMAAWSRVRGRFDVVLLQIEVD